MGHHSSPSGSLPSHSPVPSGKSENPSGSYRTTAERHKEVRAQLPHEVCGHLDADLSARLVHLWNHSIEVGVCGEIFVQGSDRSDSRVPKIAPLHGTGPKNPRWLTLGGDTRSFLHVLQAPP